jgi:hypothetical protein
VARLIELLQDANPVVRKQAAVALGETSQAIKAALQMALTDADAEVRGAVATALDSKAPAGAPAPAPAPGFKPCSVCAGKGSFRQACATCNGKGTPICTTCGGSGKSPFNQSLPCVSCNGRGTVDCFFCKGVGQVTVDCLRCGRAGVEPGP